MAAAGPEVSPVVRTPILRSVRGSLKKAEVKEYRKHLAIKYR